MPSACILGGGQKARALNECHQKGIRHMMDELISHVTAKTGLQSEQAKGAAEAVLEFLKARLPASVASSLDSVVSGGVSTSEAGGGMLGSAAAKLGGMFGKDK